jgi:signal transduction histidine kinase
MAEILSWTFVPACAVLSAVLFHAMWWRRAMQRACATERAALQDLTRLVRVTAGDLRGTALALLGRAQSAPDADRGFLLSTQAALLDMTEALLRQSEAPNACHHLHEEAIRLRPVLDFAVAQITCQLAPGRRAWRIADDLHGIELLADRRALHQILLRVLTAAALTTRDGDWITMTAAWSDDIPDGGWTLTIEDEGAGLPIEASRAEGRESRGLGVGLTLAQTLMQAHGGALTLQSAARVGTRTGLAFPAVRVIGG